MLLAKMLRWLDHTIAGLLGGRDMVRRSGPLGNSFNDTNLSLLFYFSLSQLQVEPFKSTSALLIPVSVDDLSTVYYCSVVIRT